MPALKVKEETVFVVDFKDLEEFLTSTFQIPVKEFPSGWSRGMYSFVASEELQNNSSRTFDVEPISAQEDEDDLQDFNEIIAGKFKHYITSILLNEACFRGLIRPGKYVIEVFW